MSVNEMHKGSWLSASDGGEVLESLISPNVNTISKVSVAIEHAFHVCRFRSGGQDIGQELGWGTRLVGKWLSKDLAECSGNVSIGHCFVAKSIGLTAMTIRIKQAGRCRRRNIAAINSAEACLTDVVPDHAILDVAFTTVTKEVLHENFRAEVGKADA
jgi:hypothetical protein